MPVWIESALNTESSHFLPPSKSPPRAQPLPPDAIETVSKSYLYSVGAPSRPQPSMDLREWFDEGSSGKRLKQDGHPYVEACLRESGNADLDDEDLRVLSDFIVPSEGRNYDETFRRHYRLVHK